MKHIYKYVDITYVYYTVCMKYTKETENGYVSCKH